MDGLHVRDTWIKTQAGWKRRMHEKLTVNERVADGRRRNFPSWISSKKVFYYGATGSIVSRKLRPWNL